jgi:hypothetical protein
MAAVLGPGSLVGFAFVTDYQVDASGDHDRSHLGGNN